MALGCHFSFQVKRQSRCNERSLCSDIIASSVKRICKIHFPSVTFTPKPCCPVSKSRNMILENCSHLCTKYRFAHLWHLVLGSMLKLFKLNKWMRYVIVDKCMKIHMFVPTDLLLNYFWCIFQFLYLGSNFFSLSIQSRGNFKHWHLLMHCRQCLPILYNAQDDPHSLSASCVMFCKKDSHAAQVCVRKRRSNTGCWWVSVLLRGGTLTQEKDTSEKSSLHCHYDDVDFVFSNTLHAIA